MLRAFLVLNLKSSNISPHRFYVFFIPGKSFHGKDIHNILLTICKARIESTQVLNLFLIKGGRPPNFIP